jgi:PII-like signaling protein
MLEGQRPFNPEVLTPYAVPDVRPPMGIGALVWRYTVLIPTVEGGHDGEVRSVATEMDLERLRQMFCAHFGGLTILNRIPGYGWRDPQDLASLELNLHVPFAVYARPVTASDRYFERLQQELQEALVQGLITVERQEVLLLGRSTASPVTRRLPRPTDPALPPPPPQPS